MNDASMLLRRSRAIRFGGFCAIVGLVIVLSGLAFINMIALLVREIPFVPSDQQELFGVARAILYVAGALGGVGAVIGFLTAPIKWRILALRILGITIIIVSCSFGVWVSMQYFAGDMFVAGFIMELFVALAGVASGAIVFGRARGVIVENM